MAALDSLVELNSILDEWNTENAAAGFATSDPVPKLERLAEIVEHETEAYYKMDPDPFDDRHPGKANPTCTLSYLFKALLKNEEFMNRVICEYMLDPHENQELVRASARLVLGLLFAIEKRDLFQETLVNSYLLNAQREVNLQTQACRLLYDILPGLEISVVFQETEGLVEQLFKWAEKGDEPIRSYATGLLGGAMELQDVASTFKEKNSALVPVMLNRLHALQKEMHEDFLKEEALKAENQERHFSMFGSPPRSSNTFTSPHRLSPKGEKMKTTEKMNLDKGKGASGERNGDTHEGARMNTNTKTDIGAKVVSDGSNKTSDPTVTKNSANDTKGNTSDSTKENSAENDTNKTKNVSESDSETACSSKDTVVNGVVINNGSEMGNGTTTAVNDKDGKKLDIGKNTGESGASVDSDSEDDVKHDDKTVEERKARLKRTLSPSYVHYSEDVNRLRKKRVHNDSFMLSDVSNSSWAEIQPYVIGSYSLKPLTLGMKQRLILQYLTPMGEYQELISAAFEHRAMDLVFYYINLKYNRDVRLAFEALKYLAVLLCHKKFAIEFLNRGGVQKLLDVYRPSIAACGVSLCLYYISYFDDAMERVCLLSDHILTTLTNYVLWLLECSHDSSRCHAAMFFMCSFSFVVFLNKFDAHDGLRRLYNVISTLEIMNIESNSTPNEDQLFSMRQCARHVCVALKKYFEVHLILKVNELKRLHAQSEGGSPHHETPAYKAIKINSEHVQENVELLMELMPVRQQWHPEATFHKLGGIILLTQLVAMSPDWGNYTGKLFHPCSLDPLLGPVLVYSTVLVSWNKSVTSNFTGCMSEVLES